MVRIGSQVRCEYDGCCLFDAKSWNSRYCKEHKCKGRREVQEKRIRTLSEEVQDEELWNLQEQRKLAIARNRERKNSWILENRSFAFFDLETWNLEADFGEILCACIKPRGQPSKVFVQNGKEGDKKIVRDVISSLHQYDYIVTWYGTGFDLPYLSSRAAIVREGPVGYIRHLDLFYHAKFRLKLASNRLGAVAEALKGHTTKTRVLGPVWTGAVRGDKKALEEVVEHCLEDVAELENIFERLAPSINLDAVPFRRYI